MGLSVFDEIVASFRPDFDIGESSSAPLLGVGVLIKNLSLIDDFIVFNS